MAFPGIFRQLFENSGAGPKLREDILPLTKATYTVTLTESGQWTTPYDGYYFDELQSPGGGSGGVTATNGAAASAGGGGGAYVSRVKWRKKGTIIDASIGAPGTAGIANTSATGEGTGNGGDGGDTTFDGVTAKGGKGSIGVSTAGNVLMLLEAPQAMVGGQSSSPATYGYYNRANPTAPFGSIVAGNGGDSVFGAGGKGARCSIGGTAEAHVGQNGYGYGGGAGGASANLTANVNGGRGAPGAVRITFLGV